MTERERKRRTREIERRMAARQRGSRGRENSEKGLFLFRTYVTVILVGAVFLVSAFKTETSGEITETLKSSIAYQIPGEEMAVFRDKIMALVEEGKGVLPAFNGENDKKDKELVYKPDIDGSP